MWAAMNGGRHQLAYNERQTSDGGEGMAVGNGGIIWRNSAMALA